MKKFKLICLAILMITQACKKDSVDTTPAQPVTEEPTGAGVVVPEDDASAAPVVGELAISASNIVYRKVNKNIGYNKHLFLDVDADGTIDFGFVSTLFIENNKPYLFLVINPKTSSGSKILVQKTSPKVLGGVYTYPIIKNNPVKPTPSVKTDWNITGQKVLLQGSSKTGANKQYYGLFTNLTDRYIGFRVNIKGKACYGWIKVTHQGFKDEMVVSEYAYNKTGVQIAAGQK